MHPLPVRKRPRRARRQGRGEELRFESDVVPIRGQWPAESHLLSPGQVLAHTRAADVQAPGNLALAPTPLEGESEIVAGYLTEYSTMKFAGMQLAEYAATVFIAALIAVLFLGGWQIPYVYADGIRIFDSHWVPFGEQAWYWISIFLRVHAMIFKILVLVWLQFMMRWTLPRFRYDQVMTLGWKILLPLSIANLFVTALIVTLL